MKHRSLQLYTKIGHLKKLNKIIFEIVCCAALVNIFASFEKIQNKKKIKNIYK
jgi:hypothetical protein